MVHNSGAAGAQLKLELCGGDASTKVVFLAHGFLGSRTDLSYLAEELAAQGFVCVAAEYPESLEASYPASSVDTSFIGTRPSTPNSRRLLLDAPTGPSGPTGTPPPPSRGGEGGGGGCHPH